MSSSNSSVLLVMFYVFVCLLLVCLLDSKITQSSGRIWLKFPENDNGIRNKTLNKISKKWFRHDIRPTSLRNNCDFQNMFNICIRLTLLS